MLNEFIAVFALPLLGLLFVLFAVAVSGLVYQVNGFIRDMEALEKKPDHEAFSHFIDDNK